MNTNERRINREIQDILLNAKTKEPAFDGTVKEGFERRYTVINERDLKKYCSTGLIEELDYELSLASQEIELGREMEGKKPFNNYIVINLDEPYVDEVIEIMKRHDHWG